ncbi:MAG: hypothetical protein LBJ63_06990 [Prevotellaceae bacterium]|jgi:hypothetical protein|nr:hypothetical protein [Prevotellaceae bacterium]
MRVIYLFQTSGQRDQFVNRIYESGAYVKQSGDFSNGFRNFCMYNGLYEVELEPSYIRDGNAIRMIAGLCGGQLSN